MKPGTHLKLIVTRLGGQAYGLEVADLDLFEAPQADSADSFGLHEILGYAEAPLYRNPVYARFKGAPTLLLLDGMEEILEVDTSRLRPLPRLLEPHGLEVGIACILPGRQESILVLESGRLRERLLAQARQDPPPSQSVRPQMEPPPQEKR